MPLNASAVISLVDPSQVGEARRVAARFAAAAGLGETEAGKLAIITTELANNLQRYAMGGALRFQSLALLGGSAVEVLAVDVGPGMENVSRCLQDGYSTGGTPGNGLGAIKRLSDEFDVYSSVVVGAKRGGTVMVSRVWGNGVRAAAAGVEIGSRISWGAVAGPAPGEEVNGDTWSIRQTPTSLSVMIADGLGHGPLAAEASQAAAGVFEGEPAYEPGAFLERANQQLAGSRGAAVAAAKVDLQTGSIQYSGVGNIAGTLVNGSKGKGLFSHNGIVGTKKPKVQVFTYPFPAGNCLVMHSDGLQTRWDLSDYPGLATRHPAVIAGVLLRDFLRGKDDVTVVVVRQEVGR